MKIAVVVATIGRPENVAALTASMLQQTIRPSQLIVSAPAQEDVVGVQGLAPFVQVLIGAKGASAQRNAGLDAVAPDCDTVVFLDDDAVPREDYLEQAAIAFSAHPDVVGLTGTLLRDGAAEGSPVSPEDAMRALSASESGGHALAEVRGLYGCNAAVRWSAAQDLRFDEALPLYSWLEDLDYSRRLATLGRLMRSEACVAVHLGAKSGGRQQHRRFGYSQMSNPIHLVKKRSITARHAGALVVKPFLANVLGSVRGIDWRRARLRGNLLGVGDLMRGRITPGRITDL
ncbi:glycosyltransferase family 2 protein [Clavibacter capsici]|uniref:glycosyltransferase family 2 protein n=1 Tax=Clavibacter capsici TaxID=1874630 RepID=UPI0014280F92|nr:glycosyltransferase [Clavibacter capsici]QIS42035.1 glycosyltransferase family 2 protein [Clavibacter capsici]